MLCAFPIAGTVGLHPCGQCMPCRINNQRKKTGRLILEQLHTRRPSSFITLTYRPEKLPKDDKGRGTLDKYDFRNWMKAFRREWPAVERANAPKTLRFFAVGEYGNETWRPHYHAILYGVDPVKLLQSDILPETWGTKDKGKGLWHIGTVTEKSMAYCAHYATKKMTKADHEALDGRHPEFSTGSNRSGGLGVGMVTEIAESYRTYHGAAALAVHGDIASTFRYKGKLWPLDSFMRNKIRRELDFPDPKERDHTSRSPWCAPWEPEPMPDEEELRKRLEWHNKRLRRSKTRGRL